MYRWNKNNKLTFPYRDYGTGLHIACSQGYDAIASSLLLAGADCSLQGPSKQTCLHLAAAGGHLAIVKKLLLYDAPIEVSDQQGKLNKYVITKVNTICMSDHLPA